MTENADADNEEMKRTVSQASSAHDKAYPEFDIDANDRPVKGGKAPKKKEKPKEDKKKKTDAKEPKDNKKEKEDNKQNDKKLKDSDKKEKNEKAKKDVKPKKEEKVKKEDKSKKSKNDKAKKDKNKKDKKVDISGPIVKDISEIPVPSDAQDVGNGGVVSVPDTIETISETDNKKVKANKKNSKPDKKHKEDEKEAKKKEKKKSKKDDKTDKDSKQKRSRSKSKDKNDDKSQKKKRKPSISSVASDFTDGSSFYSDFPTTDDEGGKSRKKKKKTKKKSKKKDSKKSPTEDSKSSSLPKKNGKRGSKASKDSAIVITDDESIGEKKEGKKIFGLIRVPDKHEPIVYSCCGCCSLGAGSLLTAMIFLGLGVGFMAFRISLYGKAMENSFYEFWYWDESILRKVWKIELIVGMITACLAAIASLVLLVASCIWGQKEHYKKMRKCIIFWFIFTTIALLNNIGEVIYIQAMPDTTYGIRKSTKDLKDNLATLWALTAVYFVGYSYLSIVLYSYTRLLRYMNAPKIGQNVSVIEDSDANTPASSVGNSRRSSLKNRERKGSQSSVSIDLESVRESLSKEAVQKKRLADIKQSADSREQSKMQRQSNTLPSRKNDQVYENWGYSTDQESYPSQPITRQNSATSVFQNGDKTNTPKAKPRNAPQRTIDYDSDDAMLLERLADPNPLPRRRKKVVMKTNSLGRTKSAGEPVYENQKDFLRKVTPKENKPEPISKLKPETNPKETTKKSSPETSSASIYENTVPFGRVEIETPARMRSSSLSDSTPAQQPVYDMPPTYTELEELVRKNSHGGSQADIREMSRLAEQLQKEQQELDKTGHCDPVKAENLTKMAMTALKLSEKILQDVKAGHGNIDASAASSANVSRTTSSDKPPGTDLQDVAKEFFYKLSEDEISNKADPMEEMFRMFGKDLVRQNPENAPTFMKYYLEQQQHKRNMFQPDISSTAQSEMMPWQTILNPSESEPSGKGFQTGDPFTVNIPPPPVSEIGAGFLPVDPHNPNPLNFNQRTQSAFTPTHPHHQPLHSSASNHFHPIQPGTRSQSQNPNSRPLFPVEFPLQNTPSYKPPENNMFNGPPDQNGPKNPFHPQNINRGDPRMHLHGPQNHRGPPGQQFRPHQKPHQPYPPYPYHHSKHPMSEDPYIYSDCPYSCCYDPYGDYGSVYSMYTGYDGDSIYGEGDFRHVRDPKWYPTDLNYSTYGSSYYYQQHPPDRHSETMPHLSRPSFRADTKPNVKDRRKAEKNRSLKSKSLPDLLSDDLYEESQTSSWKDNDQSSIGDSSRVSSFRSKNQSRSSSLTSRDTKKDEYLKGYKAALREALLSMQSSNSANFDSGDIEDKFLENFISKSRKSSSRKQSNNFEDDFSRKDSRSTQFTEEEFNHKPRSRKRGRVGAQDSKLISFRPSNRPGAKLVGDDLFDDYRTASMVPPNRADQDDFFLSKKSSNVKRTRSERVPKHDDDDFDRFSEFSREDQGRPSSRSSRLPSRDNSIARSKQATSAGSITSEYSVKPHVYNTLDRENQNDNVFEDTRSRTNSVRSRESRDQSVGRASSTHDRKPSLSRRSDDRSDATSRKSDSKDVQWFMGDENEPIYGSEYNGLWTNEPTVERGRPLRKDPNNQTRSKSQSMNQRESFSIQNKRAASLENNRRKVTFGRDRPKSGRF